MTRFFGKIGYVSTVREGGVSENIATEREYYGHELRTLRYFTDEGTILGEVTQQTRISVLADAYALENYEDIRYLIKAGTAWTVSSVVKERPRLVLTLGDKYNGPLASSEEEP